MRKKLVALVFIVIVLLPVGIVFAENTFGKTDVGATWWTYYTDRLYACQFNLTEAGTVNKMCLFAGNNEFGNDFRLAIYNSTWNAGSSRWQPDDLMGQTANISAPINSANAWQNITADISLEAGEYHLAWRVETDWGGKRDAGVNDQAITSGTGKGSPNEDFPSSFPISGAAYNDYEVSIFAVYTTEVGEEEYVFGTINPQFTVESHKTVSFNRYNTISQVFALVSEKTFAFNLLSSINQIFTLSSSTSFAQNVINVFATISPLFSITSYRTWSYSITSTVGLVWTLGSTVTATILRYVSSVISQVFSIASHRTTSFLIDSTLNLVTAIQSTVTLPGLVNIHATINAIFGFLSHASFTAPVEYATKGFVLVTIVLILLCFAVAVPIILRRRR